MIYLLPKMMALLHKNASKQLFKDEFFERRESTAAGHEFVQLKPVARFKDKVELRYNVGTRGNGYDQPHWPADLGVEVVS
ncbi:hypothetical protein DOTSEDRAFT_70247 [Dothistroma septosporum NZE10]|uniref:Uncharacterized protein n=1 Tax=Dothistroma septosporum (strain NZE10 / CBS 128990) TaxID=675120 RepID=N1PUV6_DOTSN|nr:hypothetical protein DOTSEDRAFT_70247 [Dothistroma septosporum NZE10]